MLIIPSRTGYDTNVAYGVLSWGYGCVNRIIPRLSRACQTTDWICKMVCVLVVRRRLMVSSQRRAWSFPRVRRQACLHPTPIPCFLQRRQRKSCMVMMIKSPQLSPRQVGTDPRDQLGPVQLSCQRGQRCLWTTVCTPRKSMPISSL